MVSCKNIWVHFKTLFVIRVNYEYAKLNNIFGANKNIFERSEGGTMNLYMRGNT